MGVKSGHCLFREGRRPKEKRPGVATGAVVTSIGGLRGVRSPSNCAYTALWGASLVKIAQSESRRRNLI
jgi:hypothetical protein